MIKPIKRVLWATDFSEESREALAYADFFARTFKAKLTALHVVPDFAPALYEVWPEVQAELVGQIEEAKANGRIKLDRMCREEGICPHKVLVTEGAAARVVLNTAKAEGSDLIVVGRRGTSGSERSLIGSVTHQILRGSRVPVLVTKGTTAKPQAIKKILVPTDFSVNEDIERDHAWRLAKALGAGLTFLYVLEIFGHDFRLTDEMFKTVLKKLEARRRSGHRAVDMREDVAHAPAAWEGIVQYAESKECELIVMATTVRRLARVFLGSTTEKVIAHSRVPVFAIPREK
jgi:nucleotide-binding universal stress UspA family protein